MKKIRPIYSQNLNKIRKIINIQYVIKMKINKNKYE